MGRLTISCGSCGQAWSVAGTFSVYEQQAVESRPCPRCEAYTLCYRDPGPRVGKRQGLHGLRFLAAPRKVG